MKRILLFAFLSVLWLESRTPITPKSYIQQWNSIFQDYQIEENHFTPKNVYSYLLHLQIKSPEIVFRQILQETGHFSSRLCLEEFKLFGMQQVGVRKFVTDIKHWKDSILDYKLWQDFYINKGWDLTDYYSFLILSEYSEDKDYVNKLKRINIEKYLR